MSHHYLSFDNVHYAYTNGTKALNGITFRITHGQRVAIAGANGAGKSTLLLLCNGLLLPTSGTVVVGGVPVSRQTSGTVRRSVGLVFQNPDDQLFMPTVEEDVAFGPVNIALPKEEVERRVVAALEDVDAVELRKRAPHTLSGGQKKRVAIATVLSMEPDVLVMDEPTSTLDARGRNLLIQRIGKFTHTILIATHDMDLAARLCDRMIILRNGEVAADGNTAELLGDKELLYHCGLI